MAYAGGTVTTPILGGFDELGKLLLQGQAQIAATMLEVDKRKQNMVNRVSDAASKIVSTGIENHDRLLLSGANQNANYLYEARQQVDRGQMSMSELSAVAAQAEKNNMLLANSSKLQDENLKKIHKGITDGDYSSISADWQNALWYNDPSTKPQVFLTKALDEAGEVKYYDEEKTQIVSYPRAGIESLETKLINGEQYMVKMKEVQLVKDGEPVFDEDGFPVTETRVWKTPITNSLSPNLKKVDKFDMTKRVGNFQKTIGNRFQYIDRSTGAITNMPYSSLGRFDSGTMVYGYTIAPQNFEDMIRDVENELATLSNDDYISLLHDYYGSRAEWQPDAKPPRSKNVVNSNESLFYDVNVGGERISIPKYYDVNGNVIGDFQYDPLVIQTHDNGDMFITDEQKRLAEAIYRNKLLTSFNVEYKDYKDFMRSGDTNSRIPPTMTYNQATFPLATSSGSIVSSPINQTYINNKLRISAAYVADIEGTNANANMGANYQNIHTRGGVVPAATLLEKQNILGDRSADVIGGFNISYMSTPTKSGDSTLNFITQDLKGLTLTGAKLKSANNVIYFDEGYDAKNNKPTPGLVVIEGMVDIASTGMADAEALPSGGQGSLQRKTSTGATDFYVLDSSELPSFYSKLWNQGNETNSFRKILEGLGYNSKAEKGGGGSDWLNAFKEYTQAMNP